MPSLSSVTIIGNAGGAPESRTTAGGQKVATFSLAVTGTGKEKSKTTWYRVSAFGKLGDICAQYVTKGKPVCVIGRLDAREYEHNGAKRISLEVVASEMTLLGSKDSSASTAPAETFNAPPAAESDIPF